MLAEQVAAFLAFEACVGMYFPLVGTLRSKYLPDAYRGVIMNLFGIVSRPHAACAPAFV